ncbi:MAG TPA: hypothetical protein VFS20_14235 [Longimicrobium sp.]|nr:hypothetical protein [Longimicrobium sp.]
MKIRVKIHWSQIFDFDDPNTLRAMVRSLPVASLVAGLTFLLLTKFGIVVAAAGAALAFVVAGALTFAAVLGMSGAASRAAMSFVAPSGSSTPSPDDYSQIKSLLVRGKIAEAITELDVQLRLRPADPALCLFAADVAARQARDPRAAEQLYLRVRGMEGVSREQDYAATNRLIDLYMGPLDDPTRAAAELERMRTRHPDTTAATHAEKTLRQLRDAAPQPR